ncbi:Na+/H+ antiporter NhaC family protein [Rubinisphaera sp.]|uniref:Na+/H+ antiporter NhaC family protein n=1 Tax=Rubinisphaera sp. TaxID=2024857 RepID=UPI000C113ABC|nr:Na+/H+ antiporter NhaC family protein [Rubinisphaera sp.]MBV10236.1 sodium:proton antiporter [Rubinisphaera sp.]HCS54176.1 sodium:proton antiporter [Planctomycetaceae bacterium]|tara:strand:+ start:8076 stop:9596 length:1521 start_codon:yes stop_codon:yes gene_type:complete
MEVSLLSLLPPVVAIVLAITLRNVMPALFLGVWVGTTIMEGGRPDLGFLRIFDTLLLQQVAAPGENGAVDYFHLHIILFTAFLGAMVGVMSLSGGSKAVLDRIAGRIDNRRHGQMLTWLSGLIIFFDDYANTLLIGGTMRPLTDRLKISREKLAFLIDSTAAPVAGLSLISTWAGFEVSLLVEGFQAVGQTVNGWEVFLATIPYRFYPLTMLLFVFLIGWTGRDYGPMLTAESKAVQPELSLSQCEVTDSSRVSSLQMRHALLPIITLLTVVAFGMMLDMDRATEVLVIASFLASVVGVVSTILSRTFTVNESMEAWIEGAKSMVPAIVILILAWMIGAICDDDHLKTGRYLQQLVGNSLSPEWLPAIAILISAAVSFMTGSSFATMGLLVVPFTELSWTALGGDASLISDPVLLGTVGSVLAGAIFGDHCSPISDTTVLSAAASDCDHLNHVETQFPYALTVGGTSFLLGCLPIGFGINVWICLLVQIVVLFVFLRIVGRFPSDS